MGYWARNLTKCTAHRTHLNPVEAKRECCGQLGDSMTDGQLKLDFVQEILVRPLKRVANQ